jgi:hypothetical protein
MGPVKAAEIPPALKYEDCLRRCDRCGIGATNAKAFAKIKYIFKDPSKYPHGQDVRQEEPPQDGPQQEEPQRIEPPQDGPSEKPQ